MNNITINYVGVDVGKEYLDVHIHPDTCAFRINNTSAGMKKLLKKLTNYRIDQIVCEASGGYEYLLLKTFQAAGYTVWVVEAARIRAFIKSEGIRAKNDAIDAKMIALFASQKKCSYTPLLLSEVNRELQDLEKRRSDLVTTRSQEKIRYQQPQIGLEAKNDIQAHIKFLDKRIDMIEEKIEKIIDNDTALKEKSGFLSSIPGIGNGTAVTIITTLPELGSITNKQAAALTGVAPIVRQSGSKKGIATTSGGRPEVRAKLYMAALSAKQHCPKLKIFYDSLLARGKKAKVALVAVMRKLIVFANILLKKGECWNPSL